MESNEACNELYSSLCQESDRGCVIVGAAFLEEELRELLREHLLSNQDALHRLLDDVLGGKCSSHQFGTAVWKIRKAKALGLLKEGIWNAMEELCHIRNEFAHRSHSGQITSNDVQRLQAKLDKISAHDVQVYIASTDRALTAISQAPIQQSAEIRRIKEFSKERKQFMGLLSFLFSFILDFTLSRSNKSDGPAGNGNR
jgi:hypothetical protein